MNGGVMLSQFRRHFYGTYLSATIPPASGLPKQIVRVEDIGTTGGGGLFVSDGTYWRPLNGHLTLSAEDLSGITTTQSMSPGTAAIPGWSLAIPSWLFARPGTTLRGMIRAAVEGTFGTGGSPQANIRADFAGGILSERNLVRTAILGSANPAGYGIGLMTRISDTSIHFIQTNSNVSWSGAGTLANNAIVTGLAAGAFNLYLSGGITTTPGAGETLRFQDVLVELLG